MNHEGAKDTKERTREEAELEVCAARVVDAALTVHRHLGPGLLESAYEACFAQELRWRGSTVQSQLTVPLVYRGVAMDTAYRIDLLVDSAIIIELKTVEKLLPIHEAQLLSYLRLTGHRLGFLLNFHVPLIKHGIKRMRNGF